MEELKRPNSLSSFKVFLTWFTIRMKIRKHTFKLISGSSFLHDFSHMSFLIKTRWILILPVTSSILKIFTIFFVSWGLFLQPQTSHFLLKLLVNIEKKKFFLLGCWIYNTKLRVIARPNRRKDQMGFYCIENSWFAPAFPTKTIKYDEKGHLSRIDLVFNSLILLQSTIRFSTTFKFDNNSDYLSILAKWNLAVVGALP